MLELVYGVLRRRLTLDCVISRFANDPISKIEPVCLNVLRLGAYQLLFLDGVPPFAAISESVDLVQRRHVGVRSLVNGLLRELSRETNKRDVALDRGNASPTKRLPLRADRVAFFSRDVFVRPEESRALYLAQIHSLPAFLVERWLKRHDGAVVEEMLEACNEKPRVSVRANRLRTDRDGLVRRLAAEGIAARAGVLAESVLVDASPLDLVQSPTFREGLHYIQDEAAMKVAAAVEAKAGERILDLCAAPGGKATHLAESAADLAEVVAVDRDAKRIARITENLERLGIRSVKTVCYDILSTAAEGEEAELPPELSGRFDAVLIDVPCSNTGVLARRPEVRWRVSEDSIRELAERGRALLNRAVSFVRPGGRIVFSTCSVEEEENQNVVSRCLVANPNLTLVRTEETLPSSSGPDGGFFAVFTVEE